MEHESEKGEQIRELTCWGTSSRKRSNIAYGYRRCFVNDRLRYRTSSAWMSLVSFAAVFSSFLCSTNCSLMTPCHPASGVERKRQVWAPVVRRS